MPILQVREALREAMCEEMRRDPRVFLMGEEVAFYDGAYKVSQGMLAEFGPDRVVDTPITEAGFAGLGIGAAMMGMRPIIEFMTWNFSLVGYDQLINNASRIPLMSGGQVRLPIVFRGPSGAGGNLGAQHSTAVASLYAHFPGLKVVACSTPADAKGLLKSAIRDDAPVIFLESELGYGVKGEVPEGEHLVPLGRADLKARGDDCTLVTWGRQVFTCLEAIERLAAEGIRCDLVDLRSLRPLDDATVFASVVRTGRCVVVHEGHLAAGFGAEVAARVQEACFDHLDAPVVRVANRDVPLPYAANLERLVLPSAERVVEAVRRLLGRQGGT